MADMGVKGHNYRHGLSGTKFCTTYNSIKQRTSDPNYSGYHKYGARGIKNEWKTFLDFKKDMYKSYLQHVKEFGEKNTSIERIDNNGNYSKKNCKWIEIKLQAKNRRNNHFISHQNKRMTIGDWEKEIGICRGLIRYRTNQGMSFGEILKAYNYER